MSRSRSLSWRFAFRSRSYGVELPPQFTPGYDLIDRDGRRVQVKTLRGTPVRARTIIGNVNGPCDVVLALRLHFDYTPAEALEMPVEVAAAYVGKNGKVAWTHKLARHPRVRRIDGAAFLPRSS